MVQKIFLTVLLTFLLSNCSKPVKPIEIISKPVEIAIVQPPAPATLRLTNIQWKVLNVDDTIYYGLRVKDYELLSNNVLEIKKYIVAQQNNLKYYKEVTGGNKEKTDASTSPITTNPTN